MEGVRCRNCGLLVGGIPAFCAHCGDPLCEPCATSSKLGRNVTIKSVNVPGVYQSEKWVTVEFPHCVVCNRLHQQAQLTLSRHTGPNKAIFASFFALFMIGMFLAIFRLTFVGLGLIASAFTLFAVGMILRSRTYGSYMGMRRAIADIQKLVEEPITCPSCGQDIEKEYSQFLRDFDAGKPLGQQFGEWLSEKGVAPSLVFCPFCGYAGPLSRAIGLRKFVAKYGTIPLDTTPWSEAGKKAALSLQYLPAPLVISTGLLAGSPVYHQPQRELGARLG